MRYQQKFVPCQVLAAAPSTSCDVKKKQDEWVDGYEISTELSPRIHQAGQRAWPHAF